MVCPVAFIYYNYNIIIMIVNIIVLFTPPPAADREPLSNCRDGARFFSLSVFCTVSFPVRAFREMLKFDLKIV